MRLDVEREYLVGILGQYVANAALQRGCERCVGDYQNGRHSITLSTAQFDFCHVNPSQNWLAAGLAGFVPYTAICTKIWP